MNWIPYVDYAFYVIGFKKGFYLKEKIELSIKSAKGSELSTKLIANREDGFALASADTTLVSHILRVKQNGKKHKIYFITKG